MVGHRNYELVTNAMHVSVYQYDDTKPAIAEGGSVRLDYTLGARTQSLMLTPAGQNKFDAARPPELTGVRKVSVQISLPGSKPHFVEFDISQSGG